MADTLKLSVGSIGERLRARRLELGLAQRDLSRPGITYAYVSRIEAGLRTPSLTALVALAEQLDTTALYLLTGESHVPCPLCGRHEHGGTSNGNGNKQHTKRRR